MEQFKIASCTDDWDLIFISIWCIVALYQWLWDGGKKIMNAPSIRRYQPDIVWLYHLGWKFTFYWDFTLLSSLTFRWLRVLLIINSLLFLWDQIMRDIWECEPRQCITSNITINWKRTPLKRKQQPYSTNVECFTCLPSKFYYVPSVFVAQSLFQLLHQQLPLKPSLEKQTLNLAAGGELLSWSPGRFPGFSMQETLHSSPCLS